MSNRKVPNAVLVVISTVFIFVFARRQAAFSETIGDSFTFVKGNKPVAAIVIDSRANTPEHLYFGKLIVEAIKKISRIELPVISAGDDTRLSGQVLIGTLRDGHLLRELLVADGVIKTQQDVAKKGYIRNLLPEDLGGQGFIIHKLRKEHKDFLIITGLTEQGTLYAINTIIDRLHIEQGQLIVDGLKTRLMPTVNVPAFKYRSLQTAVGGPDWLGPGQFMKEFGYDYKAFIDWLVSHKVNNILLQDSCFKWGLFYESKRFPELVNHDSPNIKKEYVGDIIKYGRKRGVSVFLLQNWPDRCDSILKAYPQFKAVDSHPDTLCLNKQGLMEIWKGYWDEILDRYPDVEAVGCQFAENLSMRCHCGMCSSDQFFTKEKESFDAMVKIARSKTPAVKSWIWTSPGAREVLAGRKNYPDLTVIDWRLKLVPFVLQHYVPRGDWYLYHEYGNNPEFGMKQMCMALSRRKMEGIQIRAVQFKEKDRVFQHFEEFTWNPELSIDDYAHLYIIKVLRKKDKNVTKAYAHYIRAQGYYEILTAKDKSDVSAETGNFEFGIPPEEWIDFEDYHEKYREEAEAFKIILEQLEVKSDFIEWLKAQAAVLPEAVEVKT